MPIYCVTCVSSGKKRKCANYGPEKGKRTHCGEHKIEGEINVVTTRCKSTGCTAFANWGDARTRKSAYCGKHRNEEEGLVDVAGTQCKSTGCKERATWGDVRTRKRTYCGKHRNEEEGLVYVACTLCKFPGCTVQAHYGDALTKKAAYCKEHCEDGNVNVANHRCAECSETIVTRKGDLCAACDVKINGASRRVHVKERDMVAAIKQFILEIDASIYSIVVKYDESIGAAYGSYRPDIHIDCGAFVIVIECDEFQHKTRFIRRVKTEPGGDDGDEILVAENKCVAQYDETSETKRMINIHASRGKPCYFLRFNPDPFKIGGVTSNVPIADRYVELRRQLTLALSKPPSSDIVVTYLYYDNDESFIKTKIVDIPA
jgi:hypothetical protein